MYNIYIKHYYKLCLPKTANMSVLVKCLYKLSFTKFLLSRRVLVVCTKLVNTWIQSRINTISSPTHYYTIYHLPFQSFGHKREVASKIKNCEVLSAQTLHGARAGRSWLPGYDARIAPVSTFPESNC